MQVSIIIVNYNTKNITYNCIQSIYKWTKDIDFEIILVDNNSSDSSVDYLYDYFPDVIYVRNKRNLGFGCANNIGISLAKGKYVFLLNSDTLLLNNAVKMFYDFYETSFLNIGALGCLLLDFNEKIAHSYWKFPTISNVLLENVRSHLRSFFRVKNVWLNKRKDHFFSVDYITGADLFMAKDVVVKLGGFDKRFFMYYEETDLQYRMAEEGYARYIISGPLIIHLEGASFEKKMTNTKRKMLDTSLFLYLKIHSPLYFYFLFRILYVLIRIPSFFNWRYSLSEKIDYLKLIINFSK